MKLRPALVVVLGLALASILASRSDLGISDALPLVGLSFGVAMVVFAIGRLLLRRRASPVVVALIPIASLALGSLAAALAMFVSDHDLVALEVVLVSASTAGVLGAFALAGELEAARRRVEEAAERQRVLEEARRDLVAWVSHDLRTPLAALQVMVEALDDEVVTDPVEIRTYHARMVEQTNRLAHLVDDLFELSRVETGLTLKMEPTCLGDLVSDAVASASVLAHNKGIEVRGNLPSAPLGVLASPAELSRALLNLIDNAIRHTPAGGTVTIELTSEEGVAEVSVNDECGGIPTTHIDRVFEFAFQGDPARTPGPYAGAGLGLAIAKGFVEAHRGEISVDNRGSGCCFTARLPLA